MSLHGNITTITKNPNSKVEIKEYLLTTWIVSTLNDIPVLRAGNKVNIINRPRTFSRP